MRIALAFGLAFGLALTGCPQPKRPPPTPPPPQAPTPAPKESSPTAQTLRDVVQARCLDPADPWALAHAILVDGPGLTLPGGDLAMDRLVSDWLVRGKDGALSFPRAVARRPIEPHPGLFAKTLLEAGVPTSRSFALKAGGSVTLGQIADAIASRYRPNAKVPFHNDAWQLEVVAATDSTKAKALAGRSLVVLTENQAYLKDFQNDPGRTYSKPSVKVDGARRPAFIHQYYCGGLHLFQAIQRLHGDAVPPALAVEYERLLFRLDKETEYWDRNLAKVNARFKGAELAGHLRVILSQKLKLQGHVLETYLRAVKGGMAESPSAKEALDRGFEALAKTVAELQKHGIYANLERIRAQQPQIYLDLVGDSAHALHAYKLRG
jgi:hypothetical protein